MLTIFFFVFELVFLPVGILNGSDNMWCNIITTVGNQGTQISHLEWRCFNFPLSNSQ